MGLTCDKCGERIEDGDEGVTCEDEKCGALFCVRCAKTMKECPQCFASMEVEHG